MQKQLKSFHQNPFKENTYLFFGDNRLLIVDPGVSIGHLAAPILTYAPTDVKIFYTHGHFDHIIYGNELELFLVSENIPYTSYASAKEMPYFSQKGLAHIHEIVTNYGLDAEYTCEDVPHIDFFLEDGQGIEMGDFQFYHTPGHTGGSSVLYSAKEKLLFAGDTIFANGSIGRTDFPDSSTTDMAKSLERILSVFPSETIIYPGHGMASTIQREAKFHTS